CQPAESLSYQQAFQRHLEIDPLSADKTQLREAAAKLDLSNIAGTDKPPLNNPAVRHALALSINNQRLMQSIYYGTAETAASILPR
ncbi:ABC transporter substrate-binding protein, partial [Salmonella enterica subsp. enterica serovar Montevideo]|nr:ABC transporter substrate-binding protein [Salmonella enterica subsp. enterica serovar Montevideo]